MAKTKFLLIGISTAALAAGTAFAQNSDTTDARGNREVINCAAGNMCTVDNQTDSSPTNDRNLGTVRAPDGIGSNLSVTQTGDDNVGTIEARGRGNKGEVAQEGDDNFGDIDISGEDNEGYVTQFDEDNSAVITIIGDDNQGYITQFDEDNDAVITIVGDDNFGYILQSGTYVTPGPGFGGTYLTGENNAASIALNGSDLSSVIQQGGTASSMRLAIDNSATVTQTGAGSSSTVRQEANGNRAIVNLFAGGTGASRNSSLITQDNNVFRRGTTAGTFTPGTPDEANNPETGNVADVAIAGTGNSSTVTQDGVMNRAVVSMLGGGSATSVSVTGPNGIPTPAGRPEGNSTSAFQRGGNNFYEISSGGRNPGTGLNGRGNVASVLQGFFAAPANPATNHRAIIYQRGTLDVVTIIQENNALGVGGAFQSGSVADVSMLSYDSSVTVVQTGTNWAEVSVALNADNSGGQNRVSINQTDAGDTTTTAPGSGDPFGGTPPTSVDTRRNTALISQAGIGNLIDIGQNALNASASVFQPRLSRNNSMTVRQGTGAANTALGTAGGTGANAQNLIVDVTQSDRGNNARINQDARDSRAIVTQAGTVPAENQTGANANGATANVATINQINRWQSATVSQSGFSLSAVVEQRANNGTSAFQNVVTVQQSGSGHSATARQTAAAGATPQCVVAADCPAAGNTSDPSTFPNSRAAGTRYSAEIRIIQQGTRSGTTAPGNTGNSATVEQRGLGQYAEINQNGRGNTAGILQGDAATNAVAIIQQTGDGNRFFITQSSPGQYLRVVQVGNGNANTTSVGAGPAGGGATSSTGPQPPVIAPSTP